MLRADRGGDGTGGLELVVRLVAEADRERAEPGPELVSGERCQRVSPRGPRLVPFF